MRVSPTVASVVVDRSHVPGVGVCTAYADGRVRIMFEDRVMLEIDAPALRVRGVSATGEQINVTTHAPVGVERYDNCS